MDKKRIVIKVGTSSLTYENGKLNLGSMERLVRVIADLKNSGKEIVLVSSAAIAVGQNRLGLKAARRRQKKNRRPPPSVNATLWRCTAAFFTNTAGMWLKCC